MDNNYLDALSVNERNMLNQIKDNIGFFGHTDMYTISRLYILGLITFSASGFIQLSILGQTLV